MQNIATIQGGFADGALDAQRVFRAVMDAMARPGTVQAIPPCATPPAPLGPVAGAVALALLDADTPVWLDQPLAAEAAVREWLGFQTAAPIVEILSEAHFALIAAPASMPSLENFAQGTQNYPDRSTTLILQVEGFETGGGLMLEGPGIETTQAFAPQPLPRHFIEQWRQNNARFPRGVDLVLAGPASVAALPRTTRIILEEG
ncbi:phosphonate C-P lyase system protein PhnH [Chelativorans sp. ZYF759]|uniref:phosphonate C-P lyase system protein PhnH n=1 Tax=Chelativorans sp. ZYF759 TaxID=2692213 RepID=UPI00145D5C7F|nr:phosphonate C-P lyase system protein PhnH [Chelativorans sp. ZYF759]NMG37894.1 phosphonate C-P lyase system protein PhnH [Chelativorans sp. ZYF759]